MVVVDLKRRSGPPKRVTHLFDDLAARFRLPRVEAVSWRGADGATVEGLLYHPLERTPGASNYQIFSIARQKVKDVRATSWGIEVQPLMWPDVPRTEEALEELRNAVYANPTVAGRLVSMDGKAALITAAFDEERLDYAQLFQRIRVGARAAEDGNTKVHAAGEAAGSEKQLLDPVADSWSAHRRATLTLPSPNGKVS